MLYVLCYPELTQPDADRVEAFRRIHEPERAALVAAHVTLVFGVDSVSADALIADVEAVAGRTPAFSISLDSASVYEDPGRSTFHLFLDVNQGRRALMSMHRALHGNALAAERRPEYPFVPHVTVATADAAEAVEHARHLAGKLGLPLAGRVSALHVVRLAAGRLETLAAARLVSVPGVI